MGGTIPDRIWKDWFGPEFGTLVYKRAEALELLIESNLITHHIPSPNPAHWASVPYLRCYLEDLRAKKHP
jgi:hypothetical protein